MGAIGEARGQAVSVSVNADPSSRRLILILKFETPGTSQYQGLRVSAFGEDEPCQKGLTEEDTAAPRFHFREKFIVLMGRALELLEQIRNKELRTASCNGHILHVFAHEAK